MSLGRTIDDVIPLLHTVWHLPVDLPPGVPLHASTKAAFSRCGDNTDPSSWHTQVYTDGAFDGSISSWAFAVVTVSDQGSLLRGWARGRVALHGHPCYIGAAEHSALFWATAWLLQARPDTTESVLSDCIVALGQTRGTHHGVDLSLQRRPAAYAAATSDMSEDIRAKLSTSSSMSWQNSTSLRTRLSFGPSLICRFGFRMAA